MHARLALSIAGGCLMLTAAPLSAADLVARCETQSLPGVTYFRVGLVRPAGLVPDPWNTARVNSGTVNPLAQLPRLVPQDDRAREVGYLSDDYPGRWTQELARAIPHADLLTFYGQRTGRGTAKFLLQYFRRVSGTSNDIEPVDLPIEVNFDSATELPVPLGAARRVPALRPEPTDLEGWWAVAQAQQFAVWEQLAPGFDFYGFARAALARKYDVTPIGLPGGATVAEDRHRRLYETTTGAAALTESLQLERVLGQRRREGERSIPIDQVPGIDIAEHPWKQMMAGKTPDPEPVAVFIPHDQYYIRFKTFRKFLDFTDFLEEWGGNSLRFYEVQSRDYRVKERYEKQLCLRSSLLSRTLGPIVIRSLAVTGSDPYLREGSDVAIIFQVVDFGLFRAGIEPLLREARQEFGDALREGRDEYQGVAIESFVTPLREVSLYRARADDMVIHANSLAGLKRILDARLGRRKALSDSLDFQYMRTIFRANDDAEDGFAFLSDAFIRQLVGPASKIKEKRRLEALAGLRMATNAFLLEAFRHGALPSDLNQALRAAALKSDDLLTEDQTRVTWDASRRVALSDRFNSLHFLTPLVEIPIDKVSQEERQDYESFRASYLGLWRNFFDPVGFRVRLDQGQLRAETYILPLIRNSQYDELRRMTGGGTIRTDSAPPTDKTVAQFQMHVGPESELRRSLEQIQGTLGLQIKAPWLGSWALVRFDDSPVYAKLAALAEGGSGAFNRPDEWIDLVFRMPVTVGCEIRNPLVFAGLLTSLRVSLLNTLPGSVTWEPLDPPYKDVKIVRIQATDNGQKLIGAGGKKDAAPPAIFYALIGNACYFSLQEQPIRDMIDRHAAQAAGAHAAKAEPINAELFLSAQAATETRAYVAGYLERQAHRQTLENLPIWYLFEKSGLLQGKTRQESRADLVYQFLGFVPVSADGAAFVLDPRLDEVFNTRHGSLRRPKRLASLEPGSSMDRIWDSLRTISVDFRFREDGVHSILELKRK